MLADATGILVPHGVAEVCVVVFALALCFALWVCGAVARLAGNGLPAVPQYPHSLFPNKWDQLLTAGFLIVFVWCTVLAGGDEPDGVGDGVGDGSGPGALELLVNIVFTLMLYLPMLARYFTLQKLPRPRFGFIKGGLMMLGFLMICWLGAGAVNASGITDWLVQATGCPEQQDVAVELQAGAQEGNGWSTLFIVVAAVVQAPICEECAFRGFLYNILKKHAGRVSATLASALLFSAVHASLPQLLPLFIFGVVQCLAYEKAKSLWLPMCIHAAFNGVAVLLLLHQST